MCGQSTCCRQFVAHPPALPCALCFHTLEVLCTGSSSTPMFHTGILAWFTIAIWVSPPISLLVFLRVSFPMKKFHHWTLLNPSEGIGIQSESTKIQNQNSRQTHPPRRELSQEASGYLAFTRLLSENESLSVFYVCPASSRALKERVKICRSFRSLDASVSIPDSLQLFFSLFTEAFQVVQWIVFKLNTIQTA